MCPTIITGPDKQWWCRKGHGRAYIVAGKPVIRILVLHNLFKCMKKIFAIRYVGLLLLILLLADCTGKEEKKSPHYH